VISPVFEDWKGGKYKIISFAKRARGLMARYAAQKNISQPEKLKAFDVDGYAFAPDAYREQLGVPPQAGSLTAHFAPGRLPGPDNKNPRHLHGEVFYRALLVCRSYQIFHQGLLLGATGVPGAVGIGCLDDAFGVFLQLGLAQGFVGAHQDEQRLFIGRESGYCLMAACARLAADT
jgi:hypothetical protein